MTQAHLRPCPSCERHVRVNEDGCPFCGAQFTDAFRAGPRPQGPAARLSRAALFAFGTGTLALAPGCSSSSSSSPPVAVPAYGAPGMVEDAGEDAVAPEPDASTEASTPVPDTGPPMAQPAYGIAVPIEDASDDHHVGVTPLYGIAPGN